MRRTELTFDAVDDLVGAYSRGRLGPARADLSFSPSRLGPFVELAFQSSNGRIGPLAASPWLDQITQHDMRRALAGADNSWFDAHRRRGFLRTISNPEQDDPVRTGFLIAARVAAEAVGFSVPVAQRLAAAIREMESNIHEHSQLAETGVIAYQAQDSSFEFVVADCGIGVLATLQEADEYKALTDHGRALHTTLQSGASRFGRAANRGMGFYDLFVGLATLNADLRFRSGDHALTIAGPSPDLKVAQLAQKPFYQGFLASVRCDVPAAPRVVH